MKFDWKGEDYYIDGYLANALNSIAWNVKKDWDFIIVITGNRTVRVGKSVLATQVCAYLAKMFKEFNLNDDAYGLDNLYFDNQKMVRESLEKPKHSIIHYDEGREGLASIKSMRRVQQDLLDFFAECGQLNHVFVIVLPDFFKMSEEIAVPRSEFLLNVYRKDVASSVKVNGQRVPIVKFKRGQFQFFNRRKKMNLYDKSRSTKRKNYGLIKADFVGSFGKKNALGEEPYRKRKKEALSRFMERKKEEKQSKRYKSDDIRDSIVKELVKKNPDITGKELKKYFEEKHGYELHPRSWRRIKNYIVKAIKEGGQNADG